MSEGKGLLARIFGKQSSACCSGSIEELLSEPAERDQATSVEAEACCDPKAGLPKLAAAR
jgi:hypothetical protein